MKKKAKIRDIDDDSKPEPDSQEDATKGDLFGPLVLLGLGLVAGKAAPHVRKWVDHFKAKRSGSAAAHEVESEADAAAPRAIPVEGFSNAVDAALEEHRTISSAEAERRIVEILLAAAIIARNIRALSAAQIADGASLELQAAMEKLTVPHLTDSLNRMLEADSSVLDDETSAAFTQIFSGGGILHGLYVPLRNDRVQEALRLPRRAA